MNPRLVKEADLLSDHGYTVTVVTKSVDAWSDARDEALLTGKRWLATRVNLKRGDPASRYQWLAAAAREKLSMRAYRLTRMLRCAEEGYYRGFGKVLAAVERTGANFFIAHTQGALPIAARAARRAGAPYAFDCEDLLAEEVADGLQNAALRRAILDIERAYIPGAAYVTVTSHAMAQFLAQHYGVRPAVVRNVFPLAELRDVAPPPRRVRSHAVDLVWMSATIGPGRGLESALRALVRLPNDVRLTLFGRMLPMYAKTFHALVSELSLESRVVIRPIPPAEQIMATIAQHDVGLTLDLNDCLNRSLTICNKVFLYLQAGLLVAATDTPGQREVIEAVPAAGILVPPDDPDALIAQLEPFVASRARLLEAQNAAWTAGRERYNWDHEAKTFLTALGAQSDERPLAAVSGGAP